jgi:hypothetical protein
MTNWVGEPVFSRFDLSGDDATEKFVNELCKHVSGPKWFPLLHKKGYVKSHEDIETFMENSEMAVGILTIIENHYEEDPESKFTLWDFVWMWLERFEKVDIELQTRYILNRENIFTREDGENWEKEKNLSVLLREEFPISWASTNFPANRIVREYQRHLTGYASQIISLKARYDSSIKPEQSPPKTRPKPKIPKLKWCSDDMRLIFTHGQKIRHKHWTSENVWIGVYDAELNKVAHNGFHYSLSGFAITHREYLNSDLVRSQENGALHRGFGCSENGWKTCEVEVGDEWVIVDKYASKVLGPRKMPKVKRNPDDMANIFNHGQQIRHKVDGRSVWIGTYDAELNKVVWCGKNYSLSGFAGAHRECLNPDLVRGDKWHGENGWRTCEIEIDDEWVFAGDYASKVLDS